MNQIFTEIANKYGVSVDEVKQEMQAAINAIYDDLNSHAKNVLYENDIPTIEEFLSFVLEQITNNTD